MEYRELQLVGLVVTLIALLANDVPRTQGVRACVRVCAHLEKRTISSRVVGVGTALYEDTRVYICVLVHVYVYICSYRAPRRHSLKQFRASRNGDLAIFPRGLCGRTTRKYPETSQGD